MSTNCWACGAQAELTSEFAPAIFARCPSCGLRFQPSRSAEELRHLYGGEYFEEYPGADAPYGANVADRRHEARIRLRYVQRRVAGGRLLEIGAAEGYFLELAGDAGFDAFGVEPAEEAAAVGRQRADLKIATGFVEEVELPAAPFDVACAWHVLEHISEPMAALQRIRRALAGSGLLFLEVPNADGVLARRGGASWPPLQPEHHVGQYGPRSLSALLARAGFEVEDVRTVPFFHYVRPGARLRPTMLAAHARQSARLRTLPFAGHPTKHDLLRAVARAGG